MIVRILHEGQYDVSGATMDKVHQLDEQLMAHLQNADQANFQKTLHHLLATVRQEGQRLPDQTLKESHLIIPAADFTLEEAKRLFHP